MNWQSHPVKLVSAFFDECKYTATCFLSSYTYVPSLVKDQRESLAVPHTALAGLLERMDDQLRSRNDLAFHSTFRMRVGPADVLAHLPLVDLAGDWTGTAADRLSMVLREFDCREAAVYASGHSYHLYGLHQLTETQWRRFMARLLMVNDPVQDEFVNSPVIGSYLERLFADSVDPNIASDIVRFYTAQLDRDLEYIGHTAVELVKIRAEVNEAASESLLAKVLCLLLLQNPKNDQQIVDSRWVAHRLLGGYSALRWTAHQQQYLFEPRLACRFATDGRYQVAKKQLSLSL